MALGQEYCKQLRGNLTGLHANFPPNKPLVLGDYGVKRDDVFQRLGNIRQLGVTFTATPGTPQSTFQFKTQGAVDVEFVAKGQVRPGGVTAVNAGLEIKFTKQDAIFFNAAGCTIDQIDNVAHVGEQLVALLRAGQWDTDFYVVTNLVNAESTTAIASADRSSEVLLEASAPALQQIDLADASLKLRMTRSRSTALEIVTANSQTPLMQLSRVRGLFTKVFRPEAALMDGGGGSADLPFVFTDADDEFVDRLTPVSPLAPQTPVPPRRTPTGAPLLFSDEDLGAPDLEGFRFEAAPSPFEVVRAMNAYIPLLEASYALANQQPHALPAGYVSLGEIRASATEMAAAIETASPAVREAVRTDAEAMEATADPSAFGFVVRETATGAIIVSIRGTQTPREWLANFTAVPNEFSLVPSFGLVHLGFERMWGSIRQSVLQALSGVPADVRVTVLGHSLGGAMGILGAVDLKRNLGRTSIDVCTFGGPRVGKIAFRRNFNREIPLCFRVTNQFDVVPHVPSIVTAWNHVGEEIEVDGNVDNAHSLHAYLEGLRNIGQVREVSPVVAGPEALVQPAVLSVRVP